MITSYFSPKKSSKLKTSLDNITATPGENLNEKNGSRSKSHDHIDEGNESSPLKRRKVMSPMKSPTPELEELLSHLKEKSWKEALNSHVMSPSFSRLAPYVSSQR